MGVAGVGGDGGVVGVGDGRVVDEGSLVEGGGCDGGGLFHLRDLMFDAIFVVMGGGGAGHGDKDDNQLEGDWDYLQWSILLILDFLLFLFHKFSRSVSTIITCM